MFYNIKLETEQISISHVNKIGHIQNEVFLNIYLVNCFSLRLIKLL